MGTKIETANRPKAAADVPRVPEVRDVLVNSAGFGFRTVMVRLPEGMTSDDLRDPKVWRKVQVGEAGRRLLKFDHLFILAYDESWHAEAIVTYADATSAGLAIVKVGTFRDVADKKLFSDGTYRVVWTGRGFAVERCSDNIAMGAESFTTEALAIDALRALYPRKVG